jgi:phenylalanyl-tRNA synthetase beta chain
MLDVLQRNSNRGVEEAKLFEVGSIFIPRQLPVVDKPLENTVICIGMYGKYDFFDLKGIVEGMLSRFGIRVKLKAIDDNSTFHPGRTAGMYMNEELIGIFGEISEEACDNYGLDRKVYVAEIDIEKIFDNKNTNWKYTPIPKYPAMVRDIAVKVKDEVLSGEMEEIIMGVNPNIIESVNLFDVYKGDHIEDGYKSMAFSVTYRNNERTLKDKEVERIHKKILETLETKFGATLR